MDKNKYFTPRWDIQEKLASITYLDLNRQSENYFGIYEAPVSLYLGVNKFSLIPNKDNLVPGAPIYIQAIDSKGYNVEFLVTDKQTAVGARILNLNVKQDTAPGPLRVYITSRCYISPSTGRVIPYSDYQEAPDYRKIPNIVWQTTCQVSKVKSPSPPLYYDFPDVEAYEYTRPYIEVSGSLGRQKTLTFTGSLQYLPVSTVIEGSEDLSNTLRRINPNQIFTIPQVSGSTMTSATDIKTLTSDLYPTITSPVSIFTQDMSGGIITVRPYYNNPPIDAADLTVFNGGTTLDVTIIRTISDKNVTVAGSTSYPVTYVDINGKSKISHQTSFYSVSSSILYNADPTLQSNNIGVVSKSKAISFLKFNFKNLQPESGVVDGVQFAVKPFGTSAPYTPIGPFKLDTSFIMTDSSSYEFNSRTGLEKKRIGYFTTQSQLPTYYTSYLYTKQSNSDTYVIGSGITGSFTDTNLSNSLYVTGSASDNEVIAITPKDRYLTNSLIGTEYELRLNAYCRPDSSNVTPKLDIYVNDLKIQPDSRLNDYEGGAINTPSFGSHIGTIYGRGASLFLDQKFYFTALESGKKIKPYFIIRNGNWNLSEIDIKPSLRDGRSPNEAIVEFPLDKLPIKKANTEYIFKIKYLSTSQKPGNAESIISGLRIGDSMSIDSDLLINTINNSNELQTAITGAFAASSASFAQIINELTSYTSSFAQIVTASFSNTSSFTFAHNLDYLYPIVKVYDSQDEVFYPKSIQIVDNNSVRINFSSPETGTLSVLSS